MNDFELEQMRQQMNVLKQKLDKQEIVNDRIMRKSMKRNVTNINRRYLAICIICITMIPYSYWAFVVLNGMSLGFWAATSVMMLIVFAYTIYTGRHMRSNRLLEEDLLTAREKVAKAKKMDSDWLKFGIPMIVLWIVYLTYEFQRVFKGEDFTIMAIVAGVSALVGAAIGFKVHIDTQTKYQDIIDQIEDLKTQQ